MLLLVAMTSLFLFASCAKRNAYTLEDALKLAGANRGELEKVLAYYADDSLKYRAAAFLIKEMPFYFSYVDNHYSDSLYGALKQFADSGSYDREKYRSIERRRYAQYAKVADITSVSADYLIENIEYSFRVWREQPWGKHISFRDFCEFILPYRIKDEPLTRWKKELYHRYKPLLDSLYTGTDVVEACGKMNRHLASLPWNYTADFSKPHLSALFLDRHKVGDCEDMSDLSLYVMRAVGIPVCKDTYFYSPGNMYGHCWNAVLDTNRVTLSYFYNTGDPQRGRQLKYSIGRAHRYSFETRKDILDRLLRGEYVPPVFRNYSLKDVSYNYFPDTEASFECEYLTDADAGSVWMAAFSPWGWVPIGRGDYAEGKVHFKHFEPNNYYGVLHYDEQGRERIAAPPFMVDSGNVLHQLRPAGRCDTMVLRRKYPLSRHRYAFSLHLQNGRFEASNHRDFSRATLLHTIADIPTPEWHGADVAGKGAFRYVRYISAEGMPADIGDIRWMGKEGELTGKLLHSTPTDDDPEGADPAHILDSNCLTYFTSLDKPGWIGLDLGTPRELSRIEYQPRHDDNYIRPGDLYELFYLSSQGWESLGRQRAQSLELVYRHVPGNALYWLHNLTRGKEEHIFYYKDRKQYFNIQEKIY